MIAGKKRISEFRYHASMLPATSRFVNFRFDRSFHIWFDRIFIAQLLARQIVLSCYFYINYRKTFSLCKKIIIHEIRNFRYLTILWISRSISFLNPRRWRFYCSLFESDEQHAIFARTRVPLIITRWLQLWWMVPRYILNSSTDFARLINNSPCSIRTRRSACCESLMKDDVVVVFIIGLTRLARLEFAFYLELMIRFRVFW